MEKAAQALASAKVLLATGDADGSCNRAYYAMFDAARAALMASGFEVGKTHKGILNAFSDRLIKNGSIPRETGRLLKHAEAYRYVADYGAEPVEMADARDLVDQAEAFVAVIVAQLAPDVRHPPASSDGGDG
jgi:uncharacterized protein (UPF0332 family)